MLSNPCDYFYTLARSAIVVVLIVCFANITTQSVVAQEVTNPSGDTYSDFVSEVSDDGLSYHYILPEDLNLTETIVEGGLTWTYVGQADFAFDSTPMKSTWSRTPSYILTSIEYDIEEYLGVKSTIRVDTYGRTWLLTEVDELQLRDRLEDLDIIQQELQMWDKEPSTVDTGIEYNSSSLEEVYHEFTSWTLSQCVTGGDPELYEHSSDNINPILTGYNGIQEKIVFLQFPVPGGTSICSGTMVSDKWVLTAAHCITDSSGAPINPLTLTVCTHGNVQPGSDCVSATLIEINGGVYSGNREDDYALVKVLGTPNIGDMLLSQASDSNISSHPDYTRGYPSWSNGCIQNAGFPPTITPVDGTFAAANLNKTDGSIQSTPTGYVKFNTSSAGGMSGGPHYYCPNDWDGDGNFCEDGAFITAVQSGVTYWTLFGITSGYSGGPKARDIRQWVLLMTQ